jgi:hypothetical protein
MENCCVELSVFVQKLNQTTNQRSNVASSNGRDGLSHAWEVAFPAVRLFSGAAPDCDSTLS